MILTLDLTPTEERRLAAAARQEGIPPEEAARRLLTMNLPPDEPSATDADQTASALLRGWLRDEATNDPTQIQKAQEDLDNSSAL